MKIADDITTMISDLCKIPKDEITMETRIYDSKIISSLNLLELISKFENKFNIMIDPEDLIQENFEDVKTLSTFVESRIS